MKNIFTILLALADVSHSWPDGSGLVDDPNGTVDDPYVFYLDHDEAGAPTGVMGGLLYSCLTAPEDFDSDGNLIGAVEYELMMNPALNAFLTNIGNLLGAL